jgi:hypothetical protein
MPGVRCVGVTQAASALQKRKPVRYPRGEFMIVTRRAPETAFCGFFRTDRCVCRTLSAGA